MVFRVPSNPKPSMILCTWLWRVSSHIAPFTSKQQCGGPINKPTQWPLPQHQRTGNITPVWRSDHVFSVTTLNKTGVGTGELWTNWNPQDLSQSARFFFRTKETPPFWSSKVRLVSNVAKLILPALSSAALDGKPGIVWMTQAPRSVSSPLKYHQLQRISSLFIRPHGVWEDW